MLKRLELVGFKSFADKTQFDFTAGITAVVGPNGSGKSNIVDAVRWTLGEQSAKSLRGGEMADVIFNGSTSRRSLGMAEVTLTFDNFRRSLSTDSDEVAITRRVYRSGEGEYLINHQPCRLKDIKDLFLGSGAGNDAYSIIEQGKVDVLLQSSTKDRRGIFEEAAGISRFKAKKIETLRKLERVQQNLQRLQDIIEEVEKQLRSVRLQAAKAQRHQEYSTRLKELRVALNLEEFQQLAGKLQAESAVLERLRAGLQEKSAQTESLESERQRLDEALAAIDKTIHEAETQLAQARQQIAAEETTLHHEWSQWPNLEADLASTQAHATELQGRVCTLAASAQKANQELQAAEALGLEHQQTVRAIDEHLQAFDGELTALRNQLRGDTAAHFEQAQQATEAKNNVSILKTQVEALRGQRERWRRKVEQASQLLAALAMELPGLTQTEEGLQTRLAAARQSFADQRRERDRLRQLREHTSQQAADLKAQRSGVASRIEVLEGLERSQEGLGTGVREVLTLLQQPEPGPWASVIGMIADLLTVQRDYVALIDLVLGERAQRFLVKDADELFEALGKRAEPFSGRVGFVPLAGAKLPSDLDSGAIHHPGLVTRADQVVSCENPQFAGLPAQLLQRTLIVKDLAAARDIAAQTSGCRFVTLQGEVLEPDGGVTVGAHHAETGLLSRKAELRDLRQQAAAIEQRIDQSERELSDLKDRVADLDSRLVGVQEEIDQLNEQASQMRSRLGEHRLRRDNLQEEVDLNSREMAAIEQDIQGKEQALVQGRQEAEAAEAQTQALQSRIEQANQAIRQIDQQRQERQKEFTTAKVALGKVEERLHALRARHRQIEADLEQRRQERTQQEHHLVEVKNRLQDSQRAMLSASSALAQSYLDKERAERCAAELIQDRDGHRQKRQILAERSRTARDDWHAQQEQAHKCEIEVNQLRFQHDNLIERLKEDYQLDLLELYREAVARMGPETANGSLLPAGMDPAVANEEMGELRRKLSRLGSVNLDSLQELADLESRSSNLQIQNNDLLAAKKHLEDIITTINNDSRRLFTETFQSIRTHFQELFRKLFGGGMADIVLEDETDMLECGIEIIARPPGKELRSISLMSGGEKTLTAVALLLAIFRSKPSPFCILDEVDAALDEANIGRFTAVLRDFLDRSQFILVTHSKRTMATADVLYGVTMQESGVSKRVAVRFEDWPDDGEPQNGQPATGESQETTLAPR